ncbi:MAG TPA: LolA-related protein [Burkholderiales bacterium]|nr:LolA-related protein [Burkholderiales bacterium]
MRWLRIALAAGYVLPAAAADFALSDLMRMLAQVPAAQAHFTETKHMAVLESPLVLKGMLTYRRPDRLEKHVFSPYDERTVVAGDTVTIENRTRNRTTTLSLAAAPAVLTLVESLRATLAGDVPLLERLYASRLEGRADHWILTLTPRDASVAVLIDYVRLTGMDARVVRVEVQEVGGDRSVIQMSASSS